MSTTNIGKIQENNLKYNLKKPMKDFVGGFKSFFASYR